MTQAQSSRKTEHKKTKHEQFVDLYRSDAGEEVIDMTTLERKTGHRQTVVGLVVAILLLSGVAAALGYLVFGQQRLTVESGDVTVAITMPETVASGDKLDITITYANASPTTLAQGRIELLAPQGFYLQTADPQPATPTTTIWEVQDIPAGANGTIQVSGQIVGQKADSKDFTVLFTYTPNNFSSDFQTSAHEAVTLSDSILVLTVTAPERARTGEDIYYLYTFTNSSTLPLANVKAFIDYPDGFSPVSAEPTASQSNHTWFFSQINPGEITEVKVAGTVTGDSGSSQEFILQLGLQEPDGFFNLQAQANTTVVVVNPELTLTVTAPAVVQAGGDIEYSVTITNPGEIAITQLGLLLTFSGRALESAEVELESIADLAPGASETILYSATVRSDTPADTTAIKATVSVLTASVNAAEVTFDTTATAETKLQGALTLTAAARYFDADLTKIGAGPLPPQVGKTTTYVVVWAVSAVGNAMTDGSVQTTLPDGATYVDSGDDRIQYDDSTRTVTWTVKSLERDNSKTTSWSVSVTPDQSDVNKLLVLTNETIASAVDSTTAVTVQTQVKRITSKLETDPGASDDGVVVE